MYGDIILQTGPSVEEAKVRWLEQYPEPLFRFASGETVASRKPKVLAAVTEKQLAVAIGNDHWTKLFCSVCSDYVDVAVFLPGDAHVCEKCIKRALSMFKKAAA